MFQMAFGDDEHTALEGPYVRLMKTRKWLYITAAVAHGIALELYNPTALAEAVPLIDVPRWLLVQATGGALVYLLIQYALLGWQLGSTYDLVMNERLTARRADDIAAAQDSVREAEKELLAAERQANELPGLPQFQRAIQSQLRAAETRTAEAIAALGDLVNADPASRIGYKASERMIDAMRIAPPAVFGLWGLWRLLM